MRISDAGLELIIRFEGLRLEAYKDPVGIWTIGCGHTGADVQPGLKISRPRAMQLLREDVAEAEEHVRRNVRRPPSEHLQQRGQGPRRVGNHLRVEQKVLAPRLRRPTPAGSSRSAPFSGFGPPRSSAAACSSSAARRAAT